MKFDTMIRNAMATAMSLGLGLGTIACSRDYTADYVYAVSAANGTVSAFAVDYQSGVLTQINGSPFATTMTNPGTLVSAPSGKFVYVIGGTQNAEVEEFAVGSDGKLFGENTYNLAANGTYPTAAAIDLTGSFLYVTYTYAAGFGPNHIGPGGVSIFPIKTDGSLGTPINQGVGNNPVAVAVAAPTCTTTPAVTPSGGFNCATTGSSAKNGYQNVFVYVVDAEGSTGASPTANPTVLGFSANIVQGTGSVTGTGALTPTSQTVFNTSLNTYQGITVGVSPSAMAIEPTGRFLYVTDKSINEIIGFQIDYTHTGALSAITNSPFNTGLYPVSVTVEPRGKYIYVANYNANTVSSYSINSATGALGGTAAIGNFTTATGPTCVTVDPALGIYIYTSNFLDGSVSGGQLSPNTGQVNAVVNTPFPTSTLPSCVTSVANGSHAIQIVNP
jgi:6-phosphogluconolactonase (cycloisomerase 2 family)